MITSLLLQVGGEQISEAGDSLASGVGRVADALTGEIWVNVVLSLVAIVVVFALRRVLVNVLERRVDDPTLRYKWGKGSGYVAFVLVLFLFVAIWFEQNVSPWTFIGLLTAGLAIALRDLVANLAGWIFILWRSPFDLGDRIQISGHAGDVVDIRLFQFTILEIGNWVDADQSTGRIIHIPNLKVFQEPLANYTAQFEYLWHEVAVLVTFESDWQKAKRILDEVAKERASGVAQEAEQALRKASRKFLIFYQKLSPIVYTNVKDSGVELTLRFLCKPRQRRGLREAIWEAVLERYAAEDDIDLAYPTTRLYYNPVEGKEGARAVPAFPLGGEAAQPAREGREDGSNHGGARGPGAGGPA